MAQNLSNLPIGAKIKFGKHSINGETSQPIMWLVVNKSPNITLLTEKVIDLRCFDAKEPNGSNENRAEYGNNRYSLSNIDQWLNKDGLANAWYIATHSDDSPPDTSNSSMGTHYSSRPGFLNNFTSAEKNLIQNTTIRVVKPSRDGAGYEDISRKIFLPSCTEVGYNNENSIAEGTLWSYFNSNSRIGYVNAQVYENTQSSSKPANSTSAWTWWLRTPTYSTSTDVYYVDFNGSQKNTRSYLGNIGVRPAMNLSSTVSVSDNTDSDGCYTIVWNSSPPMPTTFNVPTTIYGGKTTTISWSGVTDPDANSVTYQLEQSINGGAFTTIYNGTNLSYNTIVAYGTTSVQFRVKATDSVGASSGYNTSVSRTVINNIAPTITGSDGSLGTKSAEFTQTYTIADSNSNTVTVTEAINGVRIRSYTATLNATNTFSVTGATWLTLANGSHTMTITATDGIDTTVRTYTFVKSVSSFVIQTTTPKELSVRPTRIKLSIGREIPIGAIFKVEVCNNGFDSVKTWEDATSSVTSGLVHIFSNTTKVNAKWGVLIKVTVNRNNTSGACYVSSIGGNFE